MVVLFTAYVDWQENGDGFQFVCEICDLSECSTNMERLENFPTTNDEDSASTMDIEDKFPVDDDGEEDKPVPRRNVETKVWLKVEDMVIIDTVNGKAMNDCSYKETEWSVYQSLEYYNY